MLYQRTIYLERPSRDATHENNPSWEVWVHHCPRPHPYNLGHHHRVSNCTAYEQEQKDLDVLLKNSNNNNSNNNNNNRQSSDNESRKNHGVPKHRLKAIFSATMPPEVERIAKQYLRHPAIVSICDQESGKNQCITQNIIFLPSPSQKDKALRDILMVVKSYRRHP